METQTDHEQRMEALAARQAVALEKLTNYALWWTVLLPLIVVIVAIIWSQAA